MLSPILESGSETPNSIVRCPGSMPMTTEIGRFATVWMPDFHHDRVDDENRIDRDGGDDLAILAGLLGSCP